MEPVEWVSILVGIILLSFVPMFWVWAKRINKETHKEEPYWIWAPNWIPGFSILGLILEPLFDLIFHKIMKRLPWWVGKAYLILNVVIMFAFGVLLILLPFVF